MLDAGGDALLVQALHVIHHHGSGYLGVGGKGAVSDDDVLGIGIDIGHRGEINVESVLFQIMADGFARLIGLRRISGGAHLAHGRDAGHIEIQVAAHAGHTAAFLVHAYQRGAGKGMEGLSEGLQLLGIVYIVGEKRYAAHGILRGESLRLLIHGLHLIGHHAFRRVPENRVQGFRTHTEELAHLFPEGHGRELCPDGIFIGLWEGCLVVTGLACGKEAEGCQRDEKGKMALHKLQIGFYKGPSYDFFGK